MTSDIDLTRYARALLRRWWLIALLVAVAAGTSYGATMLLPKMYLSSITMLVGEETAAPKLSADDISLSQRAAATFAGMAKRQPVLEATVEALGLPFSWRALQNRVVVIRPDGSQFLELRVTDTDPRRARAIASELANQLILQSPTSENLRQLEQRRQFISNQLDKLQKDIQQAETTMTEKQTALTRETSARGVLDLQDEIRALDAKLTTWRNAYALLLTSVDVKRPNTLSIIEPPFTPAEPTSPNIQANVLLAASLALLLAVGTIVLIEQRVNSDALESTDDVRRAFGSTPLGTLPRLGGHTTPVVALGLAEDPNTDLAESYRLLRTSIQFAYGKDPRPLLIVTSPGAEEGKSLICAGLGVSFAHAGKRTVLVDADLRNASLHKLFNLPNDPGLTQVLEDDLVAVAHESGGDMANSRPDVEAYLVPTDVPDLFVLPAGPMSLTHPGDLFASARARTLLENVRSGVDVVIVDTPPVLPVADTAVLASSGGAVILVAQAGRTRGRAVAQAKELLVRSQARVLGVVLDGVRDTLRYHGSEHRAATDRAAKGRTAVVSRPADAQAGLAAQGPR